MLSGVGGRLDSLEDGNVGLRGVEALDVALIGEVVVEDGEASVSFKVREAHLFDSKNLNQGGPGRSAIKLAGCPFKVLSTLDRFRLSKR